MRNNDQGRKPIKNIDLSAILPTRLGRRSLSLFGPDNAQLRSRAIELARRISGKQDVMQISAHFDQLVPTVGLAPLDHLLIKMLEISPAAVQSLPFLKKRLDHIQRVVEIALIFDASRLKHVREALENYHGDLS